MMRNIDKRLQEILTAKDDLISKLRQQASENEVMDIISAVKSCFDLDD